MLYLSYTKKYYTFPHLQAMSSSPFSHAYYKEGLFPVFHAMLQSQVADGEKVSGV